MVVGKVASESKVSDLQGAVPASSRANAVFCHEQVDRATGDQCKAAPHYRKQGPVRFV